VRWGSNWVAKGQPVEKVQKMLTQLYGTLQVGDPPPDPRYPADGTLFPQDPCKGAADQADPDDGEMIDTGHRQELRG
jgi:hypothetical protein